MELKQPGPSIELRVAILCPRDPRQVVRRCAACPFAYHTSGSAPQHGCGCGILPDYVTSLCPDRPGQPHTPDSAA
eukprot:CAMPEP_0181187326 /NCGR_PEP_ID=MMETSP1096-20121128/10511_1 /TAXON_ID=156174 ORGANISM="Chrysochromulina ericina, Strain CCMP281" /NCGR_SAMPLE_ID=MMETSP1096 /ASSEMBLY_ACC=CAM_ASM_000453 /LENGTH=74 /DNA_ID=CAMNT_0023276289 /DNA_START=116 /DNA_END=340 /DNA_ORIENTATION=+